MTNSIINYVSKHDGGIVKGTVLLTTYERC